ncbi:MAG: sigma-70 family RNA polymerase sigma factor [Saprospiraceae bacterium]|nr:sigma-70 family RNA polymerase sigma factor [Saprospiraceae bacterium]
MATEHLNVPQEEQIVRLLRSKNPDGLSLLYDRYAKMMYGLLLQMLRSTPAAEEALQDTLMKIWNKAGSFDPEKGRLITWCLQIARNTAIDRLRVKRLNQVFEPEDSLNALQTGSLNPETIGVRDLLQKLAPEHREILELLYFQGFTQTEAAEALNIPLGTLKTRCYAAINQLGALFT